jgi:hypothetical protein
MKRSIEYSELVENGEVTIKLLESGDWSLKAPDKITKRDVVLIRALLTSLIDEQEILK